MKTTTITDASVQNIFSETWMERLLEATNNFSTYSLIHNAVDNPQKIYRMLKEAISEVEPSPEKAIMRVFVDDGQNPKLLEKLRNTKFNPDWDLDQWIQETLGKDQYTTTFNGVSRWNDTFHSVITDQVINPIIKKLGAPLSGIDTYAFMANSGYTPFGVHDDHDHSLIFHLGPHEKHVWIWPRKEYIEMAGNDNRVFEIEDMKKYATHYALQPGDCLFIPEGDFHIFRNDGFSVFLGFILFPSTKEKLLKESMTNLVRKESNRLDYFVKEDKFEDLTQKTLEEVFDFNSAFQQVKEAMKTSHLLLKSNGYSIHSPRIFNLDKLSKIENMTFWKPQSFPILYSTTMDNRLNIFLRGRILNLSNEEAVIHLINEFNKSEYYSYSELISLFSTYMSESGSKQLAQLFIKYRVLLPINEEDIR